MKPLEMIESGRHIGESFLTWLWMRGLKEGGTSGEDGDMSACFLDDAVQLVTERGDVKELSLRKGNPAESREAFEALGRGMRLAKAKLRILNGDLEWTCTVDAATLSASAMKLPPTQSKDMAGRAEDRLFLVGEGMGHLERRYAIFLRLVTQDGAAIEREIQEWVQAGIAQGDCDSVESPWSGGLP